MFGWLTSLKTWAIEAGAVLLAIGAALLFGYRKGEKSASNADAATAAKVTNDAITQSNAIKQKVQAMPETELDKEIDKWSVK